MRRQILTLLTLMMLLDFNRAVAQTAPSTQPYWGTKAENGMIFDLIGIAKYPAEANPWWWKPDGSPQTDALPKNPNGDKTIDVPKGMKAFTIFTHREWTGGPMIIFPKLVAPARWVRFHPAAGGQLVALIIFVPDWCNQIDLGMGVAVSADAAKRIFDDNEADLQKDHVHDFREKGLVKISALKQTNNNCSLQIEVIPFEDNPTVIDNVSITPSVSQRGGQIITGRIVNAITRSDGHLTARWVFPCKAADVVGLSCVTRDYQYCEFRHISLSPQQQTKVETIELAPSDPDAHPKAPTSQP